MICISLLASLEEVLYGDGWMGGDVNDLVSSGVRGDVFGARVHSCAMDAGVVVASFSVHK
jgi:hypothetical protein